MFRHRHQGFWLALIAAFFLTICVPCILNCQAVGTQDPAKVASVAYFPPEALDGSSGFFYVFLRSVGEPSLLAMMADDPNATAYRFDWVAGQAGMMLAVRLSVNSDGSGDATSVVSGYGKPPVVNRTQHPVSKAYVDKFSELVAWTDFWSTSHVEKANPDLHGGSNTLDADTWVLEGVRNSRYRAELRRAPAPGRFTDMVHFLLKDIANLDDSISPQPQSR
jgi:hypothetical protein